MIKLSLNLNILENPLTFSHQTVYNISKQRIKEDKYARNNRKHTTYQNSISI